jgi:S1-C subfamily serine protease
MKFIVEVELAGAPVVDKVDQPNPEVELADAPVVDKVEQPTHFNPDGPVFGATVQGQEITNVVPDSPAANAGLKVGDKILVFNGENVDDAQDFSDAVDKAAADSWLRVLGQDGQFRDVLINLNKK